MAIKIENLSKKYVLMHRSQERYTALRDVMTTSLKKWGKKIILPFSSGSGQVSTHEEFWALKDVNLEIKQGDRVGIIGRNGAGKSTLLKILSRITEPTTGRVTIKGRVASLLEVGTGFHPELTGRENIFLNGAILGMSRAEIIRKFDEIVAFAEVEKFLDTPVKRYSSGMYVRLAFAVAAHLEPEILIIDEVLAVGDAQFQKKCLGKMGDVAREGRTVLFVSHNMQAVRNLCSKVILLDKGKIVSDALTEESLSHYNKLMREIEIDSKTGIHNELVRRGSGAIRFTSVEILDESGSKRFNFEMGETIRFKMSYKVFKEMQGLVIYIALRSGTTREIITSVRHVMSQEEINAGTEGNVMVELPDIYIRPGEYPLYLHISDTSSSKTKFDVLDDLISPLVISAGDKITHSDFDPVQPIGYFSLPSNLVSSDLINESRKIPAEAVRSDDQ